MRSQRSVQWVPTHAPSMRGQLPSTDLDSYGKDKIGPGDIGAIYGAAVARVNAARAPGKWQKFEIDFRAAQFKDGKKVSNARFPRVVLNGKVIHEDVEVTKVTGGNLGHGESGNSVVVHVAAMGTTQITVFVFLFAQHPFHRLG